MSDDLAVGGPGSTTVVTTELWDEAARLTVIEHEIESCHRELDYIDSVIGSGLLGASDAPHSAFQAERAIRDGAVAIAEAKEQCELLHLGVSEAAAQYECAERFVRGLQQQVSANIAFALGSLTPLLVALFLPGVLLLSGGIAAYLATLSEKNRASLFDEVRSWLKVNSTVLTDPRVVTAVRLSVMSVDDAGLGATHLPPQIAALLGDEGVGWLGVDTSAAAVIGAGSVLGLLRETPVKVAEATAAQSTSNAHSIEDRVSRIPHDPAQIRIDRYSEPGAPDRFEVYIGGTQDFSPVSGEEPWDLTSDIVATAGGSDGSGAGSYRAVVEAMKLAGVDADSAVTFTGYSGGGVVAAQLVASGDYSAQGLITLGAPAGQVSVPHSVPYLAIEHTDDLMTGLGGNYVSSDPLVVSRQVFDEPPSSADPVLPAHRLSRYLDTAELMDTSSNLRLHEALQQFKHPQSSSVTATTYVAERVQK
ncbi:MAG: hypothetical protein ABIW32_03455 [Terrimesophilobacter sp.]